MPAYNFIDVEVLTPPYNLYNIEIIIIGTKIKIIRSWSLKNSISSSQISININKPRP